MSCSVPLSACPMCSSPVTFGGGTAMEYFGFELPASALKSCASSHHDAPLEAAAVVDVRQLLGDQVAGIGQQQQRGLHWSRVREVVAAAVEECSCGRLVPGRDRGQASLDVGGAPAWVLPFEVLASPSLPGFEGARRGLLRVPVRPPGGVLVDRPPGTPPLDRER